MKQFVSNFAKRSACVTIAGLISSASYAGNVVVGCSLTKKYSDFEVNLMVGQARSIVGEQEANRIYSKYASLMNECRKDDGASTVVSISPALGAWLAQHGVNIAKIALATR